MYLFVLVIPPGFEPRSKEPESFILSIELWDQSLFLWCKNNKIPFTWIVIFYC